MLVLTNKHNSETLQTQAPSCLFSTTYNFSEDETWVYAFESDVVLFSLPGNASNEAANDAFKENWEAKSVVNKFDIGINLDTSKGWFEHHIFGDEQGGGLWFENDELIDYDGVYSLPEDVITGIKELGFIVSENFYKQK